MKTEKETRETYAKPELVKHENLKAITFECPDWQCSVTVPGAPA
ncbi:MAG: hypothetical protein ACYC4M_03110 [Thermoleophilia bacterium]